MALVNIDSVPLCRSLTSLIVAAGAHGAGGRIRPDQLAERGDFFRERGDLLEIFVKNREADPGDGVEVTEHGGRIHLTIFSLPLIMYLAYHMKK